MKCKHPQCHCDGGEIRRDGYCSDNCQNGRTEQNGKCECGHPPCK